MRSIVFKILILLLSATSSYAQNYKSEFGFRSDNDAYLAISQDQYYTNGLFLSFRHAIKNPGFKKNVKKIWELEAGQYMYNPNTGSVKSMDEVDRPFAAYLFAGLKMNWFTSNEQVFQSNLQLGTIGPKALGKEVQEGLHNIVGFYTIRGWEYQLNNETGVNAGFNYFKLLGRQGGNDISLNTTINLGNTFSGAGIGVLYRTGAINKLFQSVTTNSRISNTAADSIPAKEFFFFMKPGINYVAYNATLQGGYFTDDKGPVTYQPNRLLFSQELGIMYAKDRWTFDFSITFQTRETKFQESSHQYGSASIFYRFN